MSTPNNQELSELSKLAEEQLYYEKRITELDELLADAKEKLKLIQENLIPEAMQAIGMSEFKLANGYKLTIKDDVYASIKKDYMIDAVDYLNSIGLGDIVKEKVECSFGRGDADKAKDLLALCKEHGYNASETLTVHPQTLKATVKEQLARGVQFPDQFFSIMPFTKSIIKAK